MESREEQIMELFNALLEENHNICKKIVIEAGEDVDAELNNLEQLSDAMRARMTSLVYGKENRD